MPDSTIPNHVRDRALQWPMVEPSVLAWLRTWTLKPVYTREPTKYPEDGFYQVTATGGPGSTGQLGIERAFSVEVDSVHTQLGEMWALAGEASTAMLALGGNGLHVASPIGPFYVDSCEETFAPAREDPPPTPGFARGTATYQLVLRPRHQ
ncbi:MAG: hypothetical protein QJR09_11880 [Micrococcus sp.]|nr:hypothetical protein [Micrococcus sp.]